MTLITKLLLPEGFEKHHLFNEMIPKPSTIEVLFLPIELNDVFGILFLLRFAALLEEWVLQTFINGQSEIWIKHENFMKKVDSLLSCSRVYSFEVYTLTLRESVQILVCLLISHETLIFFIWGTDDLENDGKLIILREWEPRAFLLDMLVRGQREARFSGEQWLSL